MSAQVSYTGRIPAASTVSPMQARPVVPVSASGLAL
jgi:hypothetical protein